MIETDGELSDGYLNQGCDRTDGELSDGYLKQGCDGCDGYLKQIVIVGEMMSDGYLN